MFHRSITVRCGVLNSIEVDGFGFESAYTFTEYTVYSGTVKNAWDRGGCGGEGHFGCA